MAALTCLAALWGGCASARDENYYRVLDATRSVLARNGLVVEESAYREDTLVAVSKVRGDFLSQTRVQVVARVELDEHGHWKPRLRVLNQWDNSDVDAWGHPNRQPRNQWINLNANAAMEARIYNQIMEEMGIHNAYEGKAWTPAGAPAERAERPAPKSVEYPLVPDEATPAGR
jgi:hypothetical protein